MRILSCLLVDRLSSSRVGGSVLVVREIFQNEGGVKAFYRGLTPNIVGNSTSWALYFLCYSNIKGAMRTWRDSQNQDLTSADFFLASGSAGTPGNEPAMPFYFTSLEAGNELTPD